MVNTVPWANIWAEDCSSKVAAELGIPMATFMNIRGTRV